MEAPAAPAVVAPADEAGAGPAAVAPTDDAGRASSRKHMMPSTKTKEQLEAMLLGRCKKACCVCFVVLHMDGLGRLGACTIYSWPAS